MDENEIKRLPRLTAIVTHLQTKRLVSAAELAAKFSVSKRTIYRDLKALEQAGIPVLSEEGRGYKLMEGYRLPPIMFSESEANALITAEQLILKNKDESFVKEYVSAINKIKSVLRTPTKDKANLLSERIVSGQNRAFNRSSNYLSTLQLALTNFNLVKIRYCAIADDRITERAVEPFAIYTNEENWLLIAFCRLRQDYRAFRMDRIEMLIVQSETFTPHTITFEEYFEMVKRKCANS